MESNWPVVKLEELLEQNTTTEKLEPEESYRLLGVRLEGKGPFIREEKPGSQIRAKSLRKVSSGEFIYSRLFAWRGAFGLISPEMDCAFVSNEFPTFKIDETRVFPKFLEMYFKQRWVWNEVEKYCTGTTKASRNRFKEKFFLNLDIPLPAKEEQKHIVARIESLLAKIEEARRLRAEAVEEAESLVGTAVLRFFAQGKKNGWSEGKIGDYVLDDLYGTSEKTTDDETGTPILRMGNIQHGRLDTSDLKYLHLNEKDRKKLLLRKGDILVNRTNSAELVGKCAVFELEEEYAFASYLIRLRFNTERANPKLVAAYINSPIGRTYMFSERKQMTGQANVNAKKLKAMPIPLPPISEQRRIVSYLDSLQAKVDELKGLQAETEKELEELVPSILDKAFKGEL